MFGIPIHGTMAHSFVQAHDDEIDSFVNFGRSRPDNLVLLLDTYDTEEAARKVVALAPRMANEGIAIRGVRLDSGDLADLALKVRRILDGGALRDVKIFASGGLDEDQILRMVENGVPIDGFGVGTNLTTSADAPALDCAYKLQEYSGIARRKKSTGKVTWPGRKQVWRQFDEDGRFAGDALGLEHHPESTGKPLIVQVMRQGRRLSPAEGLQQIRDRVVDNLIRLPAPLRCLDANAGYDVAIASSLQRLAEDVDRRQRSQATSLSERIASWQEGPMLNISPEKVCYIIVKARAFDAKVEIDDPESASNPSDDKEIDVLEDLPDDPTLEELTGAIQALNDDETLDLVALNWIGRGDYTASEWPAAREQAREIPMADRARYLVGTPQLGDYLEEGLSALGHSCEDYEIGRL
jgi:hypothetical protein